MATKAEAATV